MQFLPLDIFFQIVSFLPLIEIISLTQVGKYWYSSLSKQSKFWKNYTIVKYDFMKQVTMPNFDWKLWLQYKELKCVFSNKEIRKLKRKFNQVNFDNTKDLTSMVKLSKACLLNSIINEWKRDIQKNFVFSSPCLKFITDSMIIGSIDANYKDHDRDTDVRDVKTKTIILLLGSESSYQLKVEESVRPNGHHELKIELTNPKSIMLLQLKAFFSSHQFPETITEEITNMFSQVLKIVCGKDIEIQLNEVTTFFCHNYYLVQLLNDIVYDE